MGLFLSCTMHDSDKREEKSYIRTVLLTLLTMSASTGFNKPQRMVLKVLNEDQWKFQGKMSMSECNIMRGLMQTGTKSLPSQHVCNYFPTGTNSTVAIRYDVPRITTSSDMISHDIISHRTTLVPYMGPYCMIIYHT